MSAKEKKRVCFVAYSFPPIDAGGSIRSKNFVKYLPSFGFDCHVLTLQPSGETVDDEKLKKDLGFSSETQIHRTLSLDPFRRRHGLERGLKETKRTRILRWLSAFFLIPDRQILWVPFAVIRGLNILRENGCDLIYSTYRPASNHLVAFILKLLTRKPWVADFRDLWSGNKNLLCPTFFHRRLHEWLERQVIRSADKGVGVGEHILRGLPLNERDPKKFTVITNGFDADLLQKIKTETRTQDAIFTIGYMGSFYKRRSPQYFFNAVEKLLVGGKIDPQKFRVRFVSNFSGPLSDCPRLASVLQLKGLCTQDEALRQMAEATVLLLIVERELKDQIVNAKLFDYMGLEKPILGLVAADGVVAPYLERSGLAVTAPPDEEDKIAEKILEFYKRWEKDELRVRPNISFIRQFKVSGLTQRLASVFEELTPPKINEREFTAASSPSATA